jgi:hypothetical protein
MALFALMFGAYGVRETREAFRYGTSVRDGVEALVVAALLLTILVVVWRKRAVKHAVR